MAGGDELHEEKPDAMDLDLSVQEKSNGDLPDLSHRSLILASIENLRTEEANFQKSLDEHNIIAAYNAVRNAWETLVNSMCQAVQYVTEHPDDQDAIETEKAHRDALRFAKRVEKDVEESFASHKGPHSHPMNISLVLFERNGSGVDQDLDFIEKDHPTPVGKLIRGTFMRPYTTAPPETWIAKPDEETRASLLSPRIYEKALEYSQRGGQWKIPEGLAEADPSILDPVDIDPVGSWPRHEGTQLPVLREVPLPSTVVGPDSDHVLQHGFPRFPTGFCFSPYMALHRPVQTRSEKEDPHPERPERILKIYSKLRESNLLHRMIQVPVREVTKDEVLLVHTLAHWNDLWATSAQDYTYYALVQSLLDRLSIYMNPHTTRSARMACGGVLEVVRRVAEGQLRNGFAIIRPPGHHAEPDDASGFCFINHVAVAARWLMKKYPRSIRKVLIVDWDVHHGNGTQRAFQEDPNVLYVSLHRHDGIFYPGGDYGSAASVGDGPGEGFSVNIPFAEAGMTDVDYLYAVREIILPLASEFKPDFVLISSGFDAADGDLLGQMHVSPSGYAHMTYLLTQIAPLGRLTVALEGGYDVDAISISALGVVKTLLGDELPEHPQGPLSRCALDTVARVREVQAKYWRCFHGDLVDPYPTLGRIGPTSGLFDLGAILSQHHISTLNARHGMTSLPHLVPEQYANRVTVSATKNLFEAKKVAFIFHDMGILKTQHIPHGLSLNYPVALYNPSVDLLAWIVSEMPDVAVIDVSIPTVLSSDIENAQSKVTSESDRIAKAVSSHIWDSLTPVLLADRHFLIGFGAGATATQIILQENPLSRARVIGVVWVLGMQPAPSFGGIANEELRKWLFRRSLVVLPSAHPILHDDQPLSKKKRFGHILENILDLDASCLTLYTQTAAAIQDFLRQKTDTAPALQYPVIPFV